MSLVVSRTLQPDIVVPPRYVGLATRVIAFGLDAAVINGIAIVFAALVALALSIFSLPDDLDALAVAAGGIAYVAWSIGYFVSFWSTTGQTPGCRAMRISVRTDSGGILGPRRAAVRFAGLWLAALPLFAGYLLILVDDRRRGLQDRLARTVVVDQDPPVRVRGGSRPRASR